MLAAFIIYSFCLFGAVGIFLKPGRTQRIAEVVKNISYYLEYLVIFAVHLVRFCHSGLVCSGHYLTDADTDTSNYMIICGKWMLSYIIITWIITPILMLPTICLRGKKAGAFVMKNAY